MPTSQPATADKYYVPRAEDPEVVITKYQRFAISDGRSSVPDDIVGPFVKKKKKSDGY